MPVPVFSGHVKGGQLVIDDSRVEGYCSTRFKDDEAVDVIIRKKRKAVSDKQFRYLFGIVYAMIAEHTGHTVDEIDGMMKHRFFRCIDDRGLEYIPSKTEMSTVDDEEYAAKIRNWASIALNLKIPLPNEVELPEHALVS